MFNAIISFLKILAIGLGLIKERRSQATGAELQRGKDAQDELGRITGAVDAGNNANAGDDSLYADDPNDRSRKRKAGNKAPGV